MRVYIHLKADYQLVKCLCWIHIPIFLPHFNNKPLQCIANFPIRHIHDVMNKSHMSRILLSTIISKKNPFFEYVICPGTLLISGFSIPNHQKNDKKDIVAQKFLVESTLFFTLIIITNHYLTLDTKIKSIEQI